MPWPRLLDRIADRNKRVPATLIVHGCEPMEFGEPARNLWPRPPSGGLAGIDQKLAHRLLARSRQPSHGTNRITEIACAENIPTASASIDLSHQITPSGRRTTGYTS